MLRLLAALAAAGAAAAILTLLVGRLASDRWAWSQPLFWIPPAAPVLAAAALGAVSLLSARAARWKRGRLAAIAILLAAAAGAVWVGGFEWRLANALRRSSPPGAIRLLAWNASNVGPAAFKEAVAGQRPDILVAINPPLRLDWTDFAADLWNLPPGEAARRVRASGAMVIASRFAPVESGGTSLGLRGVVSGSAPDPLIDRGRAAFATLEVEGAEVTIWAVDLPSDPALSRAAAARQARRAINSAAIRTFRLSDRSDHYVPAESQGFPAPDIIVGDFNTTRRAASLAPLTAGLADAHTLAGLGPDATWPRRWPLLGLDQAFIGRRLHLWRYDVIDPGAGSHRMQRLLIDPPDAGP